MFCLDAQQPQLISKVRTSSKHAGATQKETIMDEERGAERAAADAMMHELIKQEEDLAAKRKTTETKVSKAKMI